ncbi:hypothetical protein CLOM621_07368 [Clostridium sp. M62/1]|nr:hypothetical protein CLOM621_07368 [Clostridium sp. M62/1]
MPGAASREAAKSYAFQVKKKGTGEVTCLPFLFTWFIEYTSYKGEIRNE